MFRFVIDGCSSAFTLFLPVHSLSTFSVQLTKNASYVTYCSIKLKFSTPEGAFVLVDMFFVRREHSRPKFDLTEYQVYISEDLPIDGSVKQINVINRTPVEITGMFFTLVAEDHNVGMFIISDSGEIKLVRELDYETTTEYLVTVIAYDKTNDVSSESVPVWILVINKNDNNPIMEKQNYDVSVSENLAVGSKILRLSATDADAEGGSYGVDITSIAFNVVFRNDSNQFTINSTTGVMTLSGQLDHEVHTFYQLVISASNPDGLTSITNSFITVQVYNVNEFTPTFSMSDYQWTVNENVAAATFNAIVARDADSGSQIQYSMLENSSLVSINSNTGIVTLLTGLDYEVKQQYLFQVVASDGQLTSQANLRVTVINVNDNPPYFKETSASIQVSFDCVKCST